MICEEKKKKTYLQKKSLRLFHKDKYEKENSAGDTEWVILYFCV